MGDTGAGVGANADTAAGVAVAAVTVTPVGDSVFVAGVACAGNETLSSSLVSSCTRLVRGSGDVVCSGERVVVVSEPRSGATRDFLNASGGGIGGRAVAMTVGFVAEVESVPAGGATTLFFFPCAPSELLIDGVGFGRIPVEPVEETLSFSTEAVVVVVDC